MGADGRDENDRSIPSDPAQKPVHRPARPLSPHLQIYRPQLTTVLSLLHRLTGMVLGAGAVALVVWLVAAACGPDAFACVQALAGSILGRVLLFGFTFCLLYHLLNGIRHLVWDTGRGLELDAVYLSGKLVVGGTIVLTIAIWIAGSVVRGGF
ncbi:MAG: succinate dehydrogenase, cytochrome b556 subunit [Dongiaceae bacterium]